MRFEVCPRDTRGGRGWCPGTVALLLLSTAACAGKGTEHDLIVSLRTDLFPGIEFDTVDVYVTPLQGEHGTELGGGERSTADTLLASYLPSGRLAEVGSLEEGSYRLDLLLSRQAEGRFIAEQTALVDLDASRSVAIPLDRSCLNVACPPLDDPETEEDESQRLACLGGQCVRPRCTEETPQFCGDLNLCETDSDCVPSASCGVGECFLGVCWARPIEAPAQGACDGASWCHPEQGCLPRSELPGGVASCSNGTQDGDEEAIDCGGSCSPCDASGSDPTADHCLDGLQNEGEEAIDCGGDCTPCRDDVFDCGSMNIPVHECRSLLVVYEELGLAELGEFEGWFDDAAPCSWSGIGCSGGKVTEFSPLDLLYKGTIPPEIGNLRDLEYLRIKSRTLYGTIPPEIGKLDKLAFLLLTGRRLQGTIPPEIGELANLETLVIYDTSITGSIPATLSGLTRATRIDFKDNRLDGTIPETLGDLPRLRDLDLDRNLLIGPIPASFANLTTLKTLKLFSNQLEGEIPLGLNNLGDIFLDITDNRCLWTSDCGAMRSWLNGEDPDWSASNAPASCDPPPGSCQ